jgi:hypothetical protein
MLNISPEGSPVSVTRDAGVALATNKSGTTHPSLAAGNPTRLGCSECRTSTAAPIPAERGSAWSPSRS